MKIKYQFLVVVTFLFVLTGCGKKELPNTYIHGSDFQYMQMNSLGMYMDVQQGTEGYYLRHGDYVYYLDESAGKIHPLCNRVDCLHDKETETRRKENCNAYVEEKSSFSKGIAYCGGYIYCLDAVHLFDHGEKQILYKISEDGSKKEQVYQWTDDRWISRWIIHRNKLYYVEQKYSEKKDGSGLIQTNSLYVIDLTDIVMRPKLIYTVDSGEIAGSSIAYVTSYGNYVYMLLVYEDMTENDNTIQTFEKWMIYDIEKGKFDELTLPNMQEDEQISDIKFWQDKILFTVVQGFEQDYSKPTTIYLADLDGMNAEQYMENIPMGNNFYSDGTYLLKTDEGMVFMAQMDILDYEKEKVTYWVYDSSLMLVDTFVWPSEVKVDGVPQMGNDKKMYLIYEDSEDSAHWGVMQWDKNAIGSYNGNAPEMITISYDGG